LGGAIEDEEGDHYDAETFNIHEGFGITKRT
jgi:hypothetical protein